MNARQKAKIYKRMYEELMKRPDEQYKIERLKVKKILSEGTCYTGK